MLGEKRHHLARDLQIRNIRIQVDPVQAFEVEDYMAIQDLVDVANMCHAWGGTIEGSASRALHTGLADPSMLPKNRLFEVLRLPLRTGASLRMTRTV
jgi:hypothetical protein